MHGQLPPIRVKLSLAMKLDSGGGQEFAGTAVQGAQCRVGSRARSCSRSRCAVARHGLAHFTLPGARLAAKDYTRF